MQGKDLIADVLPPPYYILESYLVMTLMLDAAPGPEQDALVEKSKALRSEYEVRDTYWMERLPAGDSPHDAAGIFEACEGVLLPSG